MRLRLVLLIAAGLCALAVVPGFRATADLQWPYDVDHFRDISFAQTIADGHPLEDPFYRDEWSWYNPLLPTVVAALSATTGMPIHAAEARAGAFLNIAAPIGFFVLLHVVFGPDAALAGLAVFLFAGRGEGWASPGYSPWLFASAFAQPFFYLTLAATYRGVTTGIPRYYAASGLLLGLTFLGHSVPALIAGLVVTSMVLHRLAEADDRQSVLKGFALTAILALVVGAPFLASLAHYGLQVRHGVPLIWTDLPRDDPWAFARQMLDRPFLNAAAAVGLAFLWQARDRRSRSMVLVWMFAALALFAHNQYAVIGSRRWGVEVPPMAPPHHFLLYYKAAEMTLAGIGIASLAELACRWRPQAGRWVLAGCVTLVSLLNYPAYLARDEYTKHRETALAQFPTDELRAATPWIRANTDREDVFLTTESAALTLVGPAGRKSVVVPSFFTNPYVRWAPRKEAERAMWASLASGDCRSFYAYARRYHVSRVLTVARRTPSLSEGHCGLEATPFQHSTLQIYAFPGSVDAR